jgi:hypothetical protein
MFQGGHLTPLKNIYFCFVANLGMFTTPNLGDDI